MEFENKPIRWLMR